MSGKTGAFAAVFATTHWSVVLAARNGDAAPAAAAMEALCHTYWQPLFAYILRRGYDQSDAEDLTQEFFARLLARNTVAKADREKGKFRAFLLGALKHFLANEWDRVKAVKRGGGARFTPWDDASVEPTLHVELPAGLSPEQAYDRKWALTLLDQVFARLRSECAAAGKGHLFDTLQTHLSGEKSTVSYAESAAQLEMTPGAVQIAVHRLRRRYGELLRAEIANTVSCPEEIDDELRHLFASLRS